MLHGTIPTALRLAGFLAGALLFAPAAHAVGTVDLSWNVCAPLTPDRTITPDSQNHLYVSVLGQDEPHQGYQFYLTIRDADGTVPDAWRFDVGGCQPAGGVEITNLFPDMIKTCLSLQGGVPAVQTRGYAPATPGIPGGPVIVYFTSSYPWGQPNPDSARRYLLGRLRFDHDASVPGAATLPGTCGGLDRPMCFTLEPSLTRYVTMDGATRHFTIGNGMVTANGGDCFTVPATGTTWGGIKSQYRR